MKKILLVLLLSTSIAFSQWKWVNPQPTINNLKDLSFISKYQGWICGGSGTLLKTEDGGLTWEEIKNNGFINFNSINFFNNQEAIAFTYCIEGHTGFNAILFTYDSGNNWDTLYTSPYNEIYGVYSLNKSNHLFYGRDSKLIKCVGTDSCTEVETDINSNIYDLYVKDSLNLWAACDSGMIYYSNNGGMNWELKTEKSRERLTNIHFINDTLGIAVGWGEQLLTTKNRGENWTKIETDFNFSKIFSFSSDEIWLTTNGSVIYYSEDRGESLNPINSNFPSWIEIAAIQKIDSMQYIIIGDNGRISITYNKGASWQYITKRWDQRLNSIQFVNKQFGVSVGAEGSFRKSIDGGITWNKISTGTDFELHDIQFLDEKTGFILKDLSGILKTTNGGTNWSSISKASSKVMFSFCFIDSSIGVAAGENGIITKTSNGGTSWIEKYNNASMGWFSDIIMIENVGFAVSENGKIMKSIDYGDNWELNVEYSNHTFSSVEFINKDIGWVGGHDSEYNPVILKTNNSGELWENLSSNKFVEETSIISIDFISENFGWISDDWGSILHTQDGGVNWELSHLCDYSIKSIFAIDSTNVWAVGDGGIMLTTSKLNPISSIRNNQYEKIPGGYNLAQNYPNPFNPTTKIEYNLPRNNYVILKLYDLTGRYIKNLFSGNKIKGKHIFKFDGSDLSSGIYFYTIQAGEFTSTKKMILIR